MRNHDKVLKIVEPIFFTQNKDSLLLWEYNNKEILQKSPNLEEFLKKFSAFQVEVFLDDLCTCFVKENLFRSSQEKIEYFCSLEGKKYGVNDAIYTKNLFFFLEDGHYILTQISSLEELFQIELKHSSDHLLCRVILNSNLEYVYTNRLYCIHTDYKSELGKNFFSIHESQELKDYLKDTLVKNKEYFFKNFPIQTNQNTSYWDVHIKKITLENFNQEFIAIQFVDQTEKFLFRNRERINQNLYYSILDSILDGVVCINAKGNIIFLNQSLSKMFGYEGFELIYKNINILMPEEIAAKHDEFLENYQKGQGKGNILNNIREVQGKKKTGEIFPIELKVTKIDSKEYSPLFLGIIRDLSHEKKMTKVIQEKEQEIYRLHNLELLGKMSSGIIHDISNFLQPLLFYTEIAEFEIKNMQSPEECFVEILQHLEKIKEFAFSIKNFTTEVLNFTKSIQPPKEKVPFAKYLKEIFEIFKLKHKDCFFYLDIEDSDKKVFISNESIFQIFSNLVSNAIHAMEENVTKQIFVRVRVCPTNPSIFPEFNKKYNQVFEVEFQDFGKGIPQENLPKIFEPFFTTKEKKKGTGLGLSIISEIIKRHRGKIFVESELGKGTKFTMYFLVSDEKEKFPLEKIYSESYLTISNKSNIVILEPSEEIRTSFKKYLLSQINSVFLYSHYKEFLKYETSMSEKIDYLITEIFEESFESFLIQFKAKYPNTKIIILTTREKRVFDPLSKLLDQLYYKPVSASELFVNVEF